MVNAFVSHPGRIGVVAVSDIDTVGGVQVVPGRLTGADVGHASRTTLVVEHLELIIVRVTEELPSDDVLISMVRKVRTAIIREK